MEKKSNTPVSLERLLQLKRDENPDAAFWDRFDSELKHKTLNTLIKKAPIYVRWFESLRKRVRYLVPSAAAAALAVLLSVNLSSNDSSSLILSEGYSIAADVSTKAGFISENTSKHFSSNSITASSASPTSSAHSSIRLSSYAGVNYASNLVVGQSLKDSAQLF